MYSCYTEREDHTMAIRIFRIDGMHGDQCGDQIDEELRGIDGIHVVSTDTVSNRTVIDASDDVSDIDIMRVIAHAGYGRKKGGTMPLNRRAVQVRRTG